MSDIFEARTPRTRGQKRGDSTSEDVVLGMLGMGYWGVMSSNSRSVISEESSHRRGKRLRKYNPRNKKSHHCRPRTLGKALRTSVWRSPNRNWWEEKAWKDSVDSLAADIVEANYVYRVKRVIRKGVKSYSAGGHLKAYRAFMNLQYPGMVLESLDGGRSSLFINQWFETRRGHPPVVDGLIVPFTGDRKVGQARKGVFCSYRRARLIARDLEFLTTKGTDPLSSQRYKIPSVKRSIGQSNRSVSGERKFSLDLHESFNLLMYASFAMLFIWGIGSIKLSPR